MIAPVVSPLLDGLARVTRRKHGEALNICPLLDFLPPCSSLQVTDPVLVGGGGGGGGG